MDASQPAIDSELLWDNHTDEDLGDLLDLIMKNSLPSTSSEDSLSFIESNRISESISAITPDSFSLEDLEWMPDCSPASLLRKVQSIMDLRPGFPCMEDGKSTQNLVEIIRRQSIMDEVRTKLDTSSTRVYARRHGRNATLRRQHVPSFFVPRKRGFETAPSYLALIEKLNPILFEEIHDGETSRLPTPPNDISYLYRLGQFIDVFEDVLLSETNEEYNSEEAYILQVEYDRVYDLLFAKNHAMPILGDGQHSLTHS